MKTALHYKVFTLLFILPLFVLANNDQNWKGKHTKEKKISKEYNVNSNATLKVDNSYGDLEIVTWNENRIVIDVTITTKLE